MRFEASAPSRVALLGAGVIGAGWAARFLLNGVDVNLFDPDPRSPDRVAATLEKARRAQSKLTILPPPPEGALRFADCLEEAVSEADFIQESAPERETLKRSLLRQASEAASSEAIIASSTSGIKPSLLQEGCQSPERICVGHPFNPVYLLPLVEVVGGGSTSKTCIHKAAKVYEFLGMHPLILKTEIDGFVSDRLLEALWREALHLLQDGIASVEEIDQAITHGPGLRWSIMGSFMLYRLAGGEQGMRHFLEQFGPALKLPWTKLEAPELDEKLIARIVEQSESQAEGRSIAELERLRDDCLVSVLQALRSHNHGAGAVLKAFESRLFSEHGQLRQESSIEIDQPLPLHDAVIPVDWTDYNEHLTESRYLHIFGEATDALLRFIGVDGEYLGQKLSFYTLETHIRYLAEVKAGERVQLTTQLLGADEKRIRLFHRMFRSASLVATAEHMMLHVDTSVGRACPARPEIRQRLREVADAHSGLDAPEGSGKAIAFN